MKYRTDRYGNDISILGFGCMRFPRKLGITDMKKTERAVLAAVDAGINYFDTAYIYPGSEAALGEILEKHGLRDRVRIATKLPHYLVRSPETLDRMFSEELKRLRTDHVDYYLMHMLTGLPAWDKLKALGIEDWIKRMKESGRIGQVGFSYHGNTGTFRELIDAYDWDMCLVQYNYMDEHSQAGRRGVEYAAGRGVPVFIMEPLRGGKLVKRLPEAARHEFAAHSPKRTPAQWAFDWLWDQQEITCVLSGMNSEAMAVENAAYAAAAQAGMLNDDDREMLARVVGAINAGMKVGCTGCGYCMPCPKNVDIPGTFAAYNRKYAEGRFWAGVDYIVCTALRRDSASASNCIGCGKCEQHCPQGIAIRAELQNAKRALEGPVYRMVRGVIRRFKAF